VFRWRLAPPARLEFDGLPPQVRLTLAEFMDAVVIVDPLEYQRRGDEPASPGALRTLHFGSHGDGLVTFLVHPPDDLVLVVRIQWLGE
jgi:hypothetical protein